MKKLLVLAATIAVALAAVGLGTASAALPTTTGFAPASGPPGWSVSLTGTGFTAATGVTFTPADDAYWPEAATFTVKNDSTIVATVPFFATQPLAATLTVQTPEGSATSVGDFSVDGTVGMSETQGASGEPVTLSGAGFTGATQVVFGAWVAPLLGDESFVLASSVGAHFAVLSDAAIATTVPVLRPGRHYWVTVVGPAATSVSDFSSPFLVVVPRLLEGVYGRFALRPATVDPGTSGPTLIGNRAGQRGHGIRWRMWSAGRAYGTGTVWCPVGTTLGFRGYRGSISAYRVRHGRFTRMSLTWDKRGRTRRETLKLEGVGGPSDAGYWWQP
jgi:hypothetical protein